jgi:hypothetical protein
MANGRPMTTGEIEIAISIYGNSIDYSKVSIFDTAYFLTEGRISSPDGNIHYPRGTDQTNWYSSDISTNKLVLNGVPIAQGTLIHELGHVYQFQHGINVTGRAVGDRFKNFVGGIFGSSKDDYDFRSYIKSGVPFAKWDIESQAQYFEEMYYRSIGSKGRLPDISNEELSAIAIRANLLHITPPEPKCFPSATLIQTSITESKPICEIRVGDVVMSFDPTADGGRGALVPKRVKRLFRNSTTEWIKLTWLENGEAKELVATPGHHMLDKTGAFTRLDRMVQNGKAEIVLASGEVVEAKAEHITYSAETAHMFEQAASHTQPAANGAVGLMN